MIQKSLTGKNMNILICSIVRDSGYILKDYFSQLEKVISLRPNDTFDLSIFENDSRDDSKSILENYDYKKIFKNHFVVLANLNTPKYGSVAEENRVKLLAAYRNQTLDQVKDLSIYDKIIWIEPDIFYIPEEVVKLIDSDFDVYSGISLRCNYDSLKRLDFDCEKWLEELYLKPFDGWLHGCRDGWATRIKAEHLVEPISGDEYLQYFEKGEENIPLYSTYNGFVVYNADPIKNGVRFDFINQKYNRFDCDTYVICEKFQNLGYNKVYLNKNIKILHIE